MEYKVKPEFIAVDQQTEVQITVTMDKGLGIDDKVAFALPVVWNCQRYCVTYTKEPQAADPNAPDFVSVESPDASFDISIKPIVLPSGGIKGHIKKIVAKIIQGRLMPGSILKLKLKKIRSPWLAESGEVRVWINDIEEIETPGLRTIPTEAERIRLIIPSSRKPGEPFDVNIVSLDPFWNLSCSVFRNGVLKVAGGEVLENNISFTGSYSTKIQIDEAGIHRLHFSVEPCNDTLLSNETISNPIRITEDPRGPFWGDMHSHDKMHNCGAGEHPFTYAREVSCLDFVAVTPDFRAFSQEVWKEHVERVSEANEPGEFTAILGYEVGFSEGHHNVYFRNCEDNIWDVSNQSQWNIDSLLPKLNSDNNFIAPHHVGVDWRPQEGYKSERDEWIPLIEIYSQHGLGETYAPEHILAYEFNRTRGKEQKYASSVNKPVYVRDAWAQGRRYGVVASSDDHMGQAGKPIKGLAAIYANQNSRAALFDNMKSRRTYATTGERILIDFRINDAEMGSEISAQGDDTLKFGIEVNGTDQIAFIEIMQFRFGSDKWESIFYKRIMDKNLFHEGNIPKNYDYSNSFEMKFEGNAVYYLRMAQQKTIDDYPVYAWSSPIWVVKTDSKI